VRKANKIMRESRFKSQSSGLCRFVVLWYDTNVSEHFAVSIFRVSIEAVYPLDGDSMVLLLHHYTASRRHNPEYRYLKLWRFSRVFVHAPVNSSFIVQYILDTGSQREISAYHLMHNWMFYWYRLCQWVTF